MAKLYYRYGAMNSGKSFEILKVAHNYEEQDKSVILIAPKLDTRGGEGIKSRVQGMQRTDVVLVSVDDDIFEKVTDLSLENVFCVLVDEAQFLTEKQVFQLTEIVDELGIPVMAFGLKNDFLNQPFEGSKALLMYADSIEEIKTVCWFCDRKATMNLRISDGKPVYEGEQIQVGGNESYRPVCRKCYKNPSV